MKITTTIYIAKNIESDFVEKTLLGNAIPYDLLAKLEPFDYLLAHADQRFTSYEYIRKWLIWKDGRHFLHIASTNCQPSRKNVRLAVDQYFEWIIATQ